MARKHVLALGLLSLAVVTPALADAKLASASSPSVAFTAIGPAGFKIEGKGTELSIADDAQNVTVVVPLANLKTGIELRDKHMREKYLEVGKFPNAELVVSRALLKFPAEGASNGQAQGTMKIHGRSKAVIFNYAATRAGTKLDVSGNVLIDIGDYGIDIPSYMGVTVKREVTINVRFTAVDA
jgi:polyisoprenoid-binding protein YceI